MVRSVKSYCVSICLSVCLSVSQGCGGHPESKVREVPRPELSKVASNERVLDVLQIGKTKSAILLLNFPSSNVTFCRNVPGMKSIVLILVLSRLLSNIRLSILIQINVNVSFN